MAESTLSLVWSDLMNDVAQYLGYGRESDPGTPTVWSGTSPNDQESEINRYVKQGYTQFLWPPAVPPDMRPHKWSFLCPVTSITAWTSIAESTVTATSSTANLTTTANTFYSTMPGHTVKVKAVTGTATTTTLATGRTTLDASAAVFTVTGDQNGATLTFDTSEESYTIISVTDTDTVVLDGDAAATTGNATDTFAVYIDYTIQSYTDADTVVLTATPDPVITAKTFSITANGAYRLPDDCGGVSGRVTFDSGEGYWQPIPMASETQLRSMLQASTTTGRPEMCAIRPLAISDSGAAGQRFDLMVWPIPDTNYPLWFKQLPLVDALSSSSTYPLGGMAHADTLRASCLAAAEMGKLRQRGPKWQEFMDRLSSSVQHDKQSMTPETLGVVRNPAMDTEKSWYYLRNHSVTPPTAIS